MNYQQITETSLYLLSTLEFNVGKADVKLYGGVKVANNEFTFMLADKLGPEFALPEYADATKSISNPFEMTGVTLDEFQAAGHLRAVGKEMVADLILQAKASLHGLNLKLEGSLVFENNLARLVLVSLKTNERPLTLTDFVSSVLGWNWGWMDEVTHQFAFIEGSLYYLSSTAEIWKYPGDGQTYNSGYHIKAKLQLFEKYNFDIQLDADTQNKAITVTGGVDKLDFDFVRFERPQLEIASRSGSSHFRLSIANLSVLSTPFDVKVVAGYGAGVFKGRVTKEFDVDIPAIGSSSRHHIDLAIGFEWTSGMHGGFRITEISGLPTNVLDLASEFEKYLNFTKSGGCEKIVTGWLKDLCKTTLIPAFNGSPTKVGGKMKLPLKLTYTIDLGGPLTTEQVITFDALFEIPTSLANLPGAMWGSVVASVPKIVGDILGNPETYKALALACAKKIGAAAAARFICRALNQFGRDVAQSIASGAAATGDIAAVAELAAALASLSVTVVRSIIDSFLDWLKDIWDEILHPGSKAAERTKRNNEIAAQAAQVRAAMDRVWDKVRALAAAQPVTELKVRLDSGQYIAHWTRNAISLPEGAVLKYELQLLSGGIGEQTNEPWSGMTPRSEPADHDGVTIPIISIPDYDRFQLNASVRGHITGIPFLTRETDEQLSKAINGLRGSELTAATELANQLDEDLRKLRGYKSNGVRTGHVYAVLDLPTLMTIGQSRIGVNTRIRRN